MDIKYFIELAPNRDILGAQNNKKLNSSSRNP